MPQISEKGMAMPSSPIRKLVPFADKAKERGIKVYHLNIGQPDIQTPDVALQALKTCNEKVIEYTHSAGNISYRKKLAKYYQNIGINIDENNIMITTGGSEAITIAFMSTLNPGDEIIIPEPFYANYTAEPYTKEMAKELLTQQVAHPVRWQQTVEKMIEAGVDTFVEVGAGKTLCGLIKKTSRAVKVYNVEDAETLSAAVQAIRAEGENA